MLLHQVGKLASLWWSLHQETWTAIHLKEVRHGNEARDEAIAGRRSQERKMMHKNLNP